MRWLLVLPLAWLAGGRPAPRPTAHTVEIRGMRFVPAVLTIAPGDTVVWINRDIVPHTATATRGNGFDTGLIAHDSTARYVATRAGRIRYSCTYHPTMHGSLVIQAEGH